VRRDVDDVTHMPMADTEAGCRNDHEGLPHHRRGTDGSSLGGPTVGRAAWLAKHDDADLVIVCAYSQLSRRDEAKNVATLGGDSRISQVLGRDAAGLALSEVMTVASAEGATVTAALLIDGEPAKALVSTATDRDADPDRARLAVRPHPGGPAARIDVRGSDQAGPARRRLSGGTRRSMIRAGVAIMKLGGWVPAGVMGVQRPAGTGTSTLRSVDTSVGRHLGGSTFLCRPMTPASPAGHIGAGAPPPGGL
jgi:hypothetical protein